MTKEELKKLSNDTFFDNNEGLISPDGHRRFNEAIIDTMAEYSELQRLADPLIPKHAKPLVIDEVIRDKDGLTTWNRLPNHVSYADVNVRFPIGDIMHHYSKDNDGEIKRTTYAIGPAIHWTYNDPYFIVKMPGQYILSLKRFNNTPIERKPTIESFVVTEAQAAAGGYRIDFNDIPDGVAFLGQGKQNRTFARLYYVSHNEYEQVNYVIKKGATFKYTNNPAKFSKASAGGKSVGMAVQILAVPGPRMTRFGEAVPYSKIVRPRLNLRQTFTADMAVPISLTLFCDGVPNQDFDAYLEKFYEIWYKKVKSWHYKQRPTDKRITRKIVGYIRVLPGQKITQILKPFSNRMLAPGLNSDKPQFVDFQIRLKNSEKTVVAQYRMTIERNLKWYEEKNNRMLFRHI